MSIMLFLPSFSESRKPVLTFKLQLKKHLYTTIAAEANQPIRPQQKFGHTDVILAWNLRTLSEIER